MKLNDFFIGILAGVLLSSAAVSAPADSNSIAASQTMTQVEVPPEVDKPTDPNKLVIWDMCTSLPGTKYYEGKLINKGLLPDRFIGDRSCAMSQIPCLPIDEKKERASIMAVFEQDGKQIKTGFSGTTYMLKKIESQMLIGKNYSFCGIYKSKIFNGIIVNHLESLKQEN